MASAPARRHELRVAAALGCLSGMAPDLDVVIRSDADPLLFLDYHRQFTHALAFAPLGALACAALAYPLARRWLGFGRCYLFCLLGFMSHGLLDACTSYGTQLLWPFSDVRVAWNLVAVIDPLVTVPLLVLLAVTLAWRRRVWSRMALAWLGAYLCLGLLQGWRAEQGARALAAARGHVPAELLVKPAFGNLLLWKSIYRWDGAYHVDALRPLGATTVHPGATAAVAAARSGWRAPPPASRQARDLARFRRFSAGYLAWDPADPDLLYDARYSMLPNRADGLWGIRLDPGRPDVAVRFVTDRASTPGERRELLCMLSRPGVSVAQAAAGRAGPCAQATALPER